LLNDELAVISQLGIQQDCKDRYDTRFSQ
jgi:hypothetical protein